ncbi:hypothetical protein I4F81_001677 [Pyropia yezoensis]|uniref:Uncharacterized protein n=1 Tax=Pyropia yezoensis TaxID=2788 RepID=A0ACC3BMA7_PYRYE|nr:hypothetical protein I4F81_001677 [Neopyropia yezoensis]
MAIAPIPRSTLPAAALAPTWPDAQPRRGWVRQRRATRCGSRRRPRRALPRPPYPSWGGRGSSAPTRPAAAPVPTPSPPPAPPTPATAATQPPRGLSAGRHGATAVGLPHEEGQAEAANPRVPPPPPPRRGVRGGKEAPMAHASPSLSPTHRPLLRGAW